MIKYIGSKRSLLPLVEAVVKLFPDVRTVLDLFSGTSRVGHALKGCGYQVTSNDHNLYAYTLAKCYVAADRERIERHARQLVSEFNALKGEDGYFTEVFCRKSLFFQPKNGRRIDAIRNAIAEKGLGPELEAVMLVSLMEASDRVDSTCGVQMAYLKSWAPRSYNELRLRVPDVLPRAKYGKGVAARLDALAGARRFSSDLTYVDPPYNQHSYLGNYHIWETLVAWDAPEFYGKACKRIDCRERRSAYNSKKEFRGAIEELIGSINSKLIVVSFNNEGYISRVEMERLLAHRGDVVVIEQPYKRYVGAQIGIYNLDGRKVGKVSHLENVEYIYVVDTRPRRPKRRTKALIQELTM